MYNEPINYFIDNYQSFMTCALNFTKNREDARDLMHDTLEKIIKNKEKYSNIGSAFSWNYTVMRNIFLNNIAKNRVKTSKDDISELSNDSILVKTASKNNSIDHFIGEDITKAMGRLPESYYEVFSMYIEGYKYHEIAEYFNIPVGTVKTRIHVSRKILSKILKDYRNARRK